MFRGIAAQHGLSGQHLDQAAQSPHESDLARLAVFVMPKKKSTILTSDDDLQLLKLVTLNLELEGYEALRASKGKQTLELIERHRPDLALLDVIMPRMSGFAVCHHAHAFSTVPIIMITAQGQDQDKIRGFDLSLTRIVKLFSVDELLVRVRAVLRRAQFTTGEHAQTLRMSMTLELLTIDFAQRLMMMAGRKLVLTSTEYRLLAYLVQYTGRVVIQDLLLEQVWGIAYVGEGHLILPTCATCSPNRGLGIFLPRNQRCKEHRDSDRAGEGKNHDRRGALLPADAPLWEAILHTAL